MHLNDLIQQVNERSAFELALQYTGPDGKLTSPTTVRYRIYCDTTSTEVQAWTNAADITTLTITSDDTAIINIANELEQKTVTVRAEFTGDDDLETDSYTFLVKNLGGIPQVA